jgi:hypothetical protein
MNRSDVSPQSENVRFVQSKNVRFHGGPRLPNMGGGPSLYLLTSSLTEVIVCTPSIGVFFCTRTSNPCPPGAHLCGRFTC